MADDAEHLTGSEPPSRRARRLAQRAADRVDARGPRTGELFLPETARAARAAAGLPADLSETARIRRLRLAEHPRSEPPGPPAPPRMGGRHRPTD
ncbi:hypothetical protein [Trujillonella endophytica]|uniref:Uncharacterized protein n=1 Tax=Trujillonella endophytica TaxID=673521 RepID=A0A1H8VRG5_9ACTN|nr:hypothetical protein [Trujillella endophytica]SEP17870.1 hypothetical protein SAMN05660991_03743 [Trujillella endophytica]